MNAALLRVRPNPAGYELAGMERFAHVHCSVDEFMELFGRAHDFNPGDPKVRNSWFFETPRGRASVNDYHTNPRTMLSIRAIDRRACLWVCSYLRAGGLNARGDYRHA